MVKKPTYQELERRVENLEVESPPLLYLLDI